MVQNLFNTPNASSIECKASKMLQLKQAVKTLFNGLKWTDPPSLSLYFFFYFYLFFTFFYYVFLSLTLSLLCFSISHFSPISTYNICICIYIYISMCIDYRLCIFYSFQRPEHKRKTILRANKCRMDHTTILPMQ